MKTDILSPEMQVAESVGSGILGMSHKEQVGFAHVLVGCLEEDRS